MRTDLTALHSICSIGKTVRLRVQKRVIYLIRVSGQNDFRTDTCAADNAERLQRGHVLSLVDNHIPVTDTSTAHIFHRLRFNLSRIEKVLRIRVRSYNFILGLFRCELALLAAFALLCTIIFTVHRCKLVKVIHDRTNERIDFLSLAAFEESNGLIELYIRANDKHTPVFGVFPYRLFQTASKGQECLCCACIAHQNC